MFKPVLPLVLMFSAGVSAAEPLSFSVVNPSFGGNPLNGSHLLSHASKQYTPPVVERKKQSDLDYFASQIQRRTLSVIASEFTSNLREMELAYEAEQFVVGDFTIDYDLDSEGNVTLIMNQDGQEIEITVPRF